MELVYVLVGLAAVACCLGLAAVAGMVGAKSADTVRRREKTRSPDDRV